jgi:hypothetical protein
MAGFDDYKQKAEHALEGLRTQLDELRVQANLAQAEARDRFEAAIDVLRHREAELKVSLERAKDETGGTWHALAKQVETGVDEMGDAFGKLAGEIDAALGKAGEAAKSARDAFLAEWKQQRAEREQMVSTG